MRRYANRNRDFMGMDPPIYTPPQTPSNLDPKDERLIEQALEIGRLQGANDLLAEDNGRLEDENRSLKQRNQELHEKNTELERRDSAASAGYKSGQELVDEIEKALSRKTGKK